LFRLRERAFKQFKCPRPQCVKKTVIDYTFVYAHDQNTEDCQMSLYYYQTKNATSQKEQSSCDRLWKLKVNVFRELYETHNNSCTLQVSCNDFNFKIRGICGDPRTLQRLQTKALVFLKYFCSVVYSKVSWTGLVRKEACRFSKTTTQLETRYCSWGRYP